MRDRTLILLCRVDAILLGRLEMTPAEAIEAYMKIASALSVGPAQDDDERRKNSEAFEAAFIEVLKAANLALDAPLQDKEGKKT